VPLVYQQGSKSTEGREGKGLGLLGHMGAGEGGHGLGVEEFPHWAPHVEGPGGRPVCPWHTTAAPQTLPGPCTRLSPPPAPPEHREGGVQQHQEQYEEQSTGHEYGGEGAMGRGEEGGQL